MPNDSVLKTIFWYTLEAFANQYRKPIRDALLEKDHTPEEICSVAQTISTHTGNDPIFVAEDFDE